MHRMSLILLYSSVPPRKRGGKDKQKEGRLEKYGNGPRGTRPNQSDLKPERPLSGKQVKVRPRGAY
jgi:hypothetical protein